MVISQNADTRYVCATPSRLQLALTYYVPHGRNGCTTALLALIKTDPVDAEEILDYLEAVRAITTAQIK